MIEELRNASASFGDGLIGEKEFLGMVVQIVGKKYTDFPDVEKYTGDVEVQELSMILNGD